MEQSRPAELARRINRLFETMHKRTEPPLSTAAVAATIATHTGVPVSVAELDRLRSGEGTVPSDEQLTAIAQSFGITPRYLTAASSVADIDAQLSLLCTVRDIGDAHTIRAIHVCQRSGPLA